MKKYVFMFLGLVTGIFLTILFMWNGFVSSALAEPGRPMLVSSQTPTAPWSVEGMISGPLQSDAADNEIPPAGFSTDILGPSVLPTQIPGETLVYFSTTDSDATATILYLINTDSVAHTVALRGYSYAGVLGYSLNINVPATSLVRLSSDSIAAAPPPSWSTPAPIITNFTDFTYYASLSLPKGVRVEGYMLYNPGTGTVDPRADQGAVPLRFSTDPSSVFLPAVRSGP